MALTQLTGQTPTGSTKPLPIAGLANTTMTPLGANQTWNSGIMPYNGNEAVHLAISSDVQGTYTIEYFLNGAAIGFTGNPTVYDPALVNSFQGALSGKGDSVRVTYTNGNVAQTRFYLEVRFGDDIQQTLRSIGIPMSSTNMGGTTHASIEGRQDGAGNYKQATLTDVGNKTAQDVYVANFPATQPISGTITVSNPTAATDISTLAKESGGNLAAILTQLQAINVDQGTPADTQATNSTASWGEIALLKGILNRPANASTVTNTTTANTTTVLVANPLRKGATFFSVTGTILLLLGGGASSTLFTARLITNGYYELPFGYTGIVTAIGAGTLLVTELT